MPIQNYQSFRRMTNLCKSFLPPQLVKELEEIQVRSSSPRQLPSRVPVPSLSSLTTLLVRQHDDAAVKEYGVNLAVDMMRDLRKGGVNGFHLCTLNLEKSVTKVLEKLEWVTPGQNKAVGMRVSFGLLGVRLGSAPLVR